MFGVSKVILEGDSAVLMKALTCAEVSLASYGPLIEDFKFSSRCFSQLLYSHVRRKCNKVIPSLARHATNVFYLIVWMENVLPQFVSVLQADLANFS